MCNKSGRTWSFFENKKTSKLYLSFVLIVSCFILRANVSIINIISGVDAQQSLVGMAFYANTDLFQVVVLLKREREREPNIAGTYGILCTVFLKINSFLLCFFGILSVKFVFPYATKTSI